MLTWTDMTPAPCQKKEGALIRNATSESLGALFNILCTVG